MIKDEKRQEKNNHKTQNEGNVFLLQGMCCPSGRCRNLVAHFFPQLVFSDGGQNSFFHLLPAAVVGGQVYGVLPIRFVPWQDHGRRYIETLLVISCQG